MTTLDYVKILIENRELRNDDEIEKFEYAMDNIFEIDELEDIILREESVLKGLFKGLYDETGAHEVTFGLLHGIEYFAEIMPNEKYYPIFINESINIQNEAKEWITLMNIRQLNSKNHLIEYINVAKNCSVEEKEFLKTIMKEILEEDTEKFGESIAMFINGIK